MCGIAGTWHYSPREKEVEDMLAALVHRGPDAWGLHRGDTGILGHRRLSIMDPEGGRQPIYNECGTKAIVANGEIYNFRSLRERIGSRHTFLTNSDTETALHAYEDLGAGVVEALDGMYAFAIADQDELFIARDAIGIKPLYYAQDKDGFRFSSEAEPLSELTDNIKEFPPGTHFHSAHGFNAFYTIPDITPRHMTEQQAIARIRQTLEASVIKRLMSDVPLGAFLSGGLDSSLIVAIARKNLGQPIHTFAVGIEDSRDLQAARRVSKHVGTIHHEYTLSIEEILAKLPEIIRSLESFDRDLVRSAIPCYFTSRLAAEHVKVILTGEGADELFAGYTYYKEIANVGTVLHDELRRSVSSLHNINLQRVDRLTMAHSIEGRVPFLDLEMIELAQEIPANLKLYGSPPIEKWILRRAFEDLLPQDIVWREKEQFDEGSGTVDLLDAALRRLMTDEQAARYMEAHPEAGLRCAEECYYHQVFRDVFKYPERIMKTVARWAERPGLESTQPVEHNMT